MVGGKAKLGDPDLMKKMLPGRKFDTVTVCQHDKSLNLEGETGGESWNEIVSNLMRELNSVNSSLSDLAECKHPAQRESSNMPSQDCMATVPVRTPNTGK